MNKEKIISMWMSISKNKKALKIGKIVLIIIVVLSVLYFGAMAGAGYLLSEDELAGMPCYKSGDIATVEIRGEIVSYFLYTDDQEKIDNSDAYDAVSSEEVVSCLNSIESDNSIKSIIIEIDSTGGSPYASEEIANAIKRLSKPNVAVVREYADSGAYLIASATDRIFASEWSDIGSIGVTMSYLDYYDKNSQDGLYFNQLSAGKFKDAGNPDKILTVEEEALLMRDVNIMHQGFIQKVAENRDLGTEKAIELADGSSMLGLQAKENGLIDEIGNINDAINWLNNK